MKPTKAIADLIDSPNVDAEYEKIEITNDTIEVSKTTLEKQEFEPNKYTYIDISDTKLINCTANSASTYRSTLVRTQVYGAQLTGIQLPEGNFGSVVITESRINLSNFRNSSFMACIFTDCDLTEADFGGSKLTNVRFENCTLNEADFSGCNFKRVEFINSSLATIHGVASLHGAAISETNLIEIAPLIAAEMNITVGN